MNKSVAVLVIGACLLAVTVLFYVHLIQLHPLIIEITTKPAEIILIK